MSGPEVEDWAARVAIVDGVIQRRFLRRLAGFVPGSRVGRVRWPRRVPIRPWPWHYWWQAHLLDCLVDAQRRAPHPARAVEIDGLARTVRLRNVGSWTNDYHDDIAPGWGSRCSGRAAGRSVHPRRCRRSPPGCGRAGPRPVAGASNGAAGTTSRTPRRTGRRRS